MEDSYKLIISITLHILKIVAYMSIINEDSYKLIISIPHYVDFLYSYLDMQTTRCDHGLPSSFKFLISLLFELPCFSPCHVCVWLRLFITHTVVQKCNITFLLNNLHVKVNTHESLKLMFNDWRYLQISGSASMCIKKHPGLWEF